MEKKHGVRTVLNDWTGTDFEGTDEPPWHAFIASPLRLPGDVLALDGIGDNEDDAIAQMAIKHRIKLWNEE